MHSSFTIRTTGSDMNVHVELQQIVDSLFMSSIENIICNCFVKQFIGVHLKNCETVPVMASG